MPLPRGHDDCGWAGPLLVAPPRRGTYLPRRVGRPNRVFSPRRRAVHWIGQPCAEAGASVIDPSRPLCYDLGAIEAKSPQLRPLGAALSNLMARDRYGLRSPSQARSWDGQLANRSSCAWSRGLASKPTDRGARLRRTWPDPTAKNLADGSGLHPDKMRFDTSSPES